MRLPLQTLTTFRAVARLGNLRAAAEELHLTHSAVSQQLKLLETQLGFDVFTRGGRRITINAAGEALLRSVEPALSQLEEGVRAAAAAACSAKQRLRVTVIPSFAQRWWLPRMNAWRDMHPGIALEMHTSQQVMDLEREGFHAAVRYGRGGWRGLDAEPLVDSPLIPVGSPAAAQRLAGSGEQSLAQEPLLGEASVWESWFALAGSREKVNPVATFNDAGMMLQAAEQGIGLALARKILVADALREGRLVQLSAIALPKRHLYAPWLAYPSSLRDWAPLNALRKWLQDELAESERWLLANEREANAVV